MPDRYKLYGAELSLYSGKVRSYLRKKGLCFDEIAVSVKTFRDVIVPNTGVKFIPVVQTPDGRYLQDTTIILEEIDLAHQENPVIPNTPRQQFVAQLLEVYADEWLVIPAMHYRWNFPDQNQPFIYQEFGRFVVPWAPAFVRGWLGAKAGEKFKSAVSRLGVTEQTIPAVEASYEALLDDLQTHFIQHPFLLGSKPCIADFSFIGPLYAHLYRDPAPGALMRRRAPAVAAWVERMMSAEPYLLQGAWLDDDAIPATLEPIIQRMAREQYPVLKATNQALNEWRHKNPEAHGVESPVARYIGSHEFNLGGASGNRVILPYSLWMLQRALEKQDLAVLKDDVEFSQWLAKQGLGDILDMEFTQALCRKDNQLYFQSTMT